MKTLVAQPSLVDQVKAAIFEAILDGTLQPGERLIQEQVAQRLGVSRQPVQQALVVMRDQGLVVDAPGRGLMVPPLDLSHVEHVYQIRAELEGMACRQIAKHITSAQVKNGLLLIDKGRRAVEAGSVAKMISADIAFHQFIYRCSGNPLIDSTMAPHLVYTQRVMGEVLMRDQEPRDIWGQHEAIWLAVSNSDPSRAEALVEAHLLNACGYMLERLEHRKKTG
jgi:DNA-binding GntR family transcriptional regulator